MLLLDYAISANVWLVIICEITNIYLFCNKKYLNIDIDTECKIHNLQVHYQSAKRFTLPCSALPLF